MGDCVLYLLLSSLSSSGDVKLSKERTGKRLERDTSQKAVGL